jgi:hypothetical protein
MFMPGEARGPTDHRHSILVDPFSSIAPEMCCLHIVRVVIPPRASHPFGIPMVWHDVVVICELFVTNRAFPVLLDNLPIQQFPHFSRRPEFPISSRMMRILNPSNPRLQSARIGRLFPTAAGNRFVNRAVFIATKAHAFPPMRSSEILRISWKSAAECLGIDVNQRSCRGNKGKDGSCSLAAEPRTVYCRLPRYNSPIGLWSSR